MELNGSHKREILKQQTDAFVDAMSRAIRLTINDLPGDPVIDAAAMATVVIQGEVLALIDDKKRRSRLKSDMTKRIDLATDNARGRLEQNVFLAPDDDEEPAMQQDSAKVGEV